MSPSLRAMSGISSTLLPAVLLLLGCAAAPAAADWPPWLERWLFNADERTEHGVESFERGAADATRRSLETALRLQSDRPLAQYNAGTARLNAETGAALPLLEAAAESGEAEWLAAARYNLGNARMAGGDLAAAIEAYKGALRHDPGLAAAKYNLELAQRLLQRQQQAESPEADESQDQQDDRQGTDAPPEPEAAETDDEDQSRDESQSQDQSQPGQGPEEPSGDPQAAGEEPHSDAPDEPQDRPPDAGGNQPRQSPLPRFRDLPDMTAEEAAAILEAIENMEREQRRREALEAARRGARGKKDW